MLLEIVSKYRNKLGVQLDLKLKLSKILSDIQFVKPANYHKPPHLVTQYKYANVSVLHTYCCFSRICICCYDE